MEQVSFKWQRFGALSTTELHAIYRLRQRVFIVEQNCPYLDADQYDLETWHLSAWSTEDRAILAYLRVFPPGVKYAEASIGRVVTAPEARGTGLGRQIMDEALARIRSELSDGAVRISAQSYLRKFYESFRFSCVSEGYLEDDIPHIEMLRS